VLPVEDDATQKSTARGFDRPLRANVGRDVLRVKGAGGDVIAVVRVPTLLAVVAVAEIQNDRLGKIVLEVDAKNVRLVDVRSKRRKDYESDE
jgi:hypothetical protein